MRPQIICLLSVCAIALATLVACKTDEERVMAWYEKTHAALAPELPHPLSCHYHAPAVTRYHYELNASSDTMTRRVQNAALLMQQGSIADGMRQWMQKQATDHHLALVDARTEKLKGETGWTNTEFWYCTARVRISSEPGYCSGYAERLRRSLDSGSDLIEGDVISIEYCLEAAPDFLQGL